MKNLILVFAVVFVAFACDKANEVKPTTPVVKDSIITIPPNTPSVEAVVMPDKFIGTWKPVSTCKISLFKESRIMFPSIVLPSPIVRNYYSQKEFDECDYYNLIWISWGGSTDDMIFTKYSIVFRSPVTTSYCKYENGNTVSYSKADGEKITKGAERWNDFANRIFIKNDLYSTRKDSLFWVSYDREDFNYPSRYSNTVRIHKKQ